MKEKVSTGESAMRMRGLAMMCGMPMHARIPNHANMMGPKTFPIFDVPLRWARKSAVRIARATGTTYVAMVGKATSRPSTAESTEMAGVMTESPKNSAAPKTPRRATAEAIRPGFKLRRTLVARARIPPSPSLSARSTKQTYFRVTMRMSTQMMQEMTPVTSSSSRRTAPLSSVKTVRNTYSGLVPMSPKTTPKAAKPRPAEPACAAVSPFLRNATFMRAILRRTGRWGDIGGHRLSIQHRLGAQRREVRTRQCVVGLSPQLARRPARS